MLGNIGSERLLRVIKSFAPSQPTQSVVQFAGRADVLSQVISAVEEHRNHLVIFGGRGTGKTSLVLTMSSMARHVGYHCSYVSCSRESTIVSIIRSALSDLSIRYDQHFDPRNEALDPTACFDSLVPDGNVSPQELVDILARIKGTRLLVVIDEFDRNENPSLTRDLTEVMKVVSDRDISVQIVIVGVGEVVDHLVGEHTSIARVLYVVRLSSMSDQQIRETLAVASHYAGVELEPDVVAAIVGVAHGRPYIARLAGLKAAKMALLRNSLTVNMLDFAKGTDELLGYLESAGFGPAAHLIAASPRHLSLFMAMLQCRRDASDCFTASDVLSALEVPSHVSQAHANVAQSVNAMLTSASGLLNKVDGGSEPQYRFSDPRAELCISILCWRARAAEGRQKTVGDPVPA